MKMKNGFTLLEVVVSMLVISLIVAGSFSLYITASQFVDESKHRLQAVNQAAGVLEKLRYYVSADSNNPRKAGRALAIGTNLSPTLIGLNSTPDIDNVNSANWYYDISTISDSNCSQVTVTVDWETL